MPTLPVPCRSHEGEDGLFTRIVPKALLDGFAQNTEAVEHGLFRLAVHLRTMGRVEVACTHAAWVTYGVEKHA